MWTNHNNVIDVTIIIPTHNSSRYIYECMDSVLSQTYRNIEIICVDSSYKDDTKRILQTYNSRDSRIFIIIDDDSSYGHKINVGIDKARGQYIMILESDDKYKPIMVEKLYSIIEKTGVDFVKCEHSCFGAVGEDYLELPNRHFSDEIYDKVLFRDSFKDWNIGSLYHIWTGIYRKDFLYKNKVHFNESAGASYQDIGFSILCNIFAESVYFISDPLYMYRVDNADSSVKSNSKYLCIKDEHDWAYVELKNKGKIDKRIGNYLKLIRYSGYRWNYQRLNHEYKEKFISVVRDEASNKSDTNGSEYSITNADIDVIIRESENLDNYPQIELVPLLDAIIKQDECVLYGTGRVGRYVIDIQELSRRKSIKMACDNSHEKQGGSFYGIRVIDPKAAIQEFPTAKFIIANRNETKNIKEWLRESGVEDDRIITFSRLSIDAEILAGCIIEMWNKYSKNSGEANEE